MTTFHREIGIGKGSKTRGARGVWPRTPSPSRAKRVVRGGKCLGVNARGGKIGLLTSV